MSKILRLPPRKADRHHREKFIRYERRKAEWLEKHPNASPYEYDNAMRKIAKECGV